MLVRAADKRTSQTHSTRTLCGVHTAKKSHHTEEKCWKLHGKPQSMNKTWSEKSGQSKGQGQAHIAISHSYCNLQQHK